MPTSRIRAAMIASAVVAVTIGVAPPASAAGSTGWVRIAHLSPDTKTVDVRLAPLDGPGGVVAVDDVSYGSVSKYLSLPAGAYAVAMRPAGAPDSSTPVVKEQVTVKRGSAATVAVFGKNADLTTKVIPDALTLPKAGTARVRVVQASTATDPVTVTAAPDTTIVSSARTTTVSPYADVKAGRWALTATQGSDRATSSIDLKAGQIASVFVLDDSSGGIVLRRVLDSASVGGVPKGFLATGGGYLAHRSQQQSQEALLLAGAAVAAAGLVAGVAVRRRRVGA